MLLPQPVLTAQCASLLRAWGYRSSDRLLHVLPLNHIHGIVNALLAPLVAGACVELLRPPSASAIWSRFAAPFRMSPPAPDSQQITLFTAVPTMYAHLTEMYRFIPQPTKSAAKASVHPSVLRVAMSGSYALPPPIGRAWTDISGNVLLERYGMTEVGMALSCGLAVEDRVEGSVGWPLPSVDVRLVDPDSGAALSADAEQPGEIQVRGPTVFSEYWNRPAETESAFVRDEDGARWFRTGDLAVRRSVAGPGSETRGGPFFVLGRMGTDFVKVGGEKVSTLEIERELLALPIVAEACVVGAYSETWGEKIVAVVVPSDLARSYRRPRRGPFATLANEVRYKLRPRLAAHKLPREVYAVDRLPRNAMGKVQKAELARELRRAGS